MADHDRCRVDGGADLVRRMECELHELVAVDLWACPAVVTISPRTGSTASVSPGLPASHPGGNLVWPVSCTPHRQQTPWITPCCRAMIASRSTSVSPHAARPAQSRPATATNRPDFDHGERKSNPPQLLIVAASGPMSTSSRVKMLNDAELAASQRARFGMTRRWTTLPTAPRSLVRARLGRASAGSVQPRRTLDTRVIRVASGCSRAGGRPTEPVTAAQEFISGTRRGTAARRETADEPVSRSAGCWCGVQGGCVPSQDLHGFCGRPSYGLGGL